MTKTTKSKKTDLAVGRLLLSFALIFLAFLSVLASFNEAGIFGEWIKKISKLTLGKSSFVLVPVLLLLLSGISFSRFKLLTKIFLAVGAALWVSLFSALFSFSSGQEAGGMIGYLLANALAYIFGDWGGVALALVLFLAGLAVIARKITSLVVPESKGTPSQEQVAAETPGELKLAQQSKKGLLDKLSPAQMFERRKIPRIEQLSESSVGKKPDVPEPSESHALPSTRLLEYEKPGSGTQGQEIIKQRIETIQRTLGQFGIPVQMHGVNVGPSVTQYTLKPSEGIKLAQITALKRDMALALAAHPIRIEAPIPGKSLVGIEVPNTTRKVVRLRNLLEHPSYKEYRDGLSFPLGRNVSGDPVYDRLVRMPHLLIAGSTGSGKSVAIHNILTTLLLQKPPEHLKLILIDAKRVELTVYNDIPHLLSSVITEPEKAIRVLKWATVEMDRRYELFSDVGIRDIVSYNQKMRRAKAQPMPYIVIVIDELADIMSRFGKDMEGVVVRLAQMARAVGIHLILSTQRPSVDVITGLIKANITYRMAFKVASQIDSRTIIDKAGAENLLGQGDMLYLSDDGTLKRIQGVFLSEGEIKRVVRYWRKQELASDQDVLENNLSKALERSRGVDLKDDELYADALNLIVAEGKASTTLLQRRLRLGYARAARLLDLLERRGVVGPAHGSKPREVLIKNTPKV